MKKKQIPDVEGDTSINQCLCAKSTSTSAIVPVLLCISDGNFPMTQSKPAFENYTDLLHLSDLSLLFLFAKRKYVPLSNL